ncbi:hypothetical protein [Streptomyces sp. HB132]|uniref:hypothetical protein n=1 Tax=Streptomyces sp. HB132 TaxID=767388 RepID=UPI00195F2B9E|nr:hypothetical protein [Streptomyces sp. HB132]MBM7442619.1 hypothetical protein [Streptomyces sp. HB132]
MTFPQAPALPEELDKLMRRMRLPYMCNAAPDVLATTRAQRWDPAEVLQLLTAEGGHRPRRGHPASSPPLGELPHRQDAGLPAGRGLHHAEGPPRLRGPTQNSLTNPEWIGRAENLVIAGPSVINGF